MPTNVELHNLIQGLQGKIEDLEKRHSEEMKSINTQLQILNDNLSKQHNNSSPTWPKPGTSDRENTANHQNRQERPRTVYRANHNIAPPPEDIKSILIMDSNAKRLFTGGLQTPERGVAIIPCSLAEGSKDCYDVIKDHPKLDKVDKIIISLGSNDIYNGTENSKIVEALAETKIELSKLPQKPKIEVLQILPQRGNDVKIATVNELLNKNETLKAIKAYRNISKDDLFDDRHLLSSSRYKLANALKYYLHNDPNEETNPDDRSRPKPTIRF